MDRSKGMLLREAGMAGLSLTLLGRGEAMV